MFGAPLDPADLAALGYREQVETVRDALDALGDANEQPNPAQPAMAQAVAAHEAAGLDTPWAVVRALVDAVADPSDETRALLGRIRPTEAPVDERDVWLQTLIGKLRP